MTAFRPAAQAFDAVAPVFDKRFGGLLSVIAQRRAVYRTMLDAFPGRGRILELGGGTGEDALWMAENSFEVFLTDAAPVMIAAARIKLAATGFRAECVAAEDLDRFAQDYLLQGGALFDGAFSNFAPLNCVEEIDPVALGLARLIRPGGHAMLVLFGTCSPGEALVEILRGRPGQALRRRARGPVSTGLGGKQFAVVYHRRAALKNAMRPWFRLESRRGIGIFVPPSAAEPWISRHPRFLRFCEALDRLIERPLAMLGDHVLYRFTRTEVPAP